jgi:hypothetical protein
MLENVFFRKSRASRCSSPRFPLNFSWISLKTITFGRPISKIIQDTYKFNTIKTFNYISKPLKIFSLTQHITYTKSNIFIKSYITANTILLILYYFVNLLVVIGFTCRTPLSLLSLSSRRRCRRVVTIVVVIALSLSSMSLHCWCYIAVVVVVTNWRRCRLLLHESSVVVVIVVVAGSVHEVQRLRGGHCLLLRHPTGKSVGKTIKKFHRRLRRRR